MAEDPKAEDRKATENAAGEDSLSPELGYTKKLMELAQKNPKRNL